MNKIRSFVIEDEQGNVREYKLDRLVLSYSFDTEQDKVPIYYNNETFMVAGRVRREFRIHCLLNKAAEMFELPPVSIPMVPGDGDRNIEI